MPTRVKICGITCAGDARLAVELGASALGFNFYPPSLRYIAPRAAREIIRTLPPAVMAVGVFADESDWARVRSVAREAAVAAIQLHGPRFPSLLLRDLASGGAKGFVYLVIRAIPVAEGFEPESLRSIHANAFLLDAFDGVLKGGTGRIIEWTKAREATRYGRVILAGGLTPENVAEAISQVQPFGVDVASGVEASPGVKDECKLRRFFLAVRAADQIPGAIPS
jgi:phosphoribosylanthranilate isomerase